MDYYDFFVCFDVTMDEDIFLCCWYYNPYNDDTMMYMHHAQRHRAIKLSSHSTLTHKNDNRVVPLSFLARKFFPFLNKRCEPHPWLLKLNLHTLLKHTQKLSTSLKEIRLFVCAFKENCQPHDDDEMSLFPSSHRRANIFISSNKTILCLLKDAKFNDDIFFENIPEWYDVKEIL